MNKSRAALCITLFLVAAFPSTLTYTNTPSSFTRMAAITLEPTALERCEADDNHCQMRRFISCFAESVGVAFINPLAGTVQQEFCHFMLKNALQR